MNAKPKDIVIANARIVLADRVIEQRLGRSCRWPHRRNRRGQGARGREDAGGDLIMPGLIELHTDHLEAHYVPRPKVFWDPVAAVISYDGQLATSGITTVLDSLRVWREDGAEEVDGRAGVLAAAITTARDCQPAARRSLPASALRNPDAERGRGGQGADRPSRRPADVADGSHARPAPVPRRGQAARLLSRQGRRHDRRRARRAVREALRVSADICRDQHARDRGAGARIRDPAREP